MTRVVRCGGMKRIVTIQDISCVGKCSLTVALPIISAMGVEAAIIPTAVLSTHTMFKGFTFRDLTSDIEPIMEHWKNEGFKFDAIYTGYLGSFEQIELMHRLIAEFKGPKTKVIVDPCMADNGKLYPGFTPEFAKAMAGLCAEADIILPNLTEASFMLGEPYVGSGKRRNGAPTGAYFPRAEWRRLPRLISACPGRRIRRGTGRVYSP